MLRQALFPPRIPECTYALSEQRRGEWGRVRCRKSHDAQREVFANDATTKPENMNNNNKTIATDNDNNNNI